MAPDGNWPSDIVSANCQSVRRLSTKRRETRMTQYFIWKLIDNDKRSRSGDVFLIEPSRRHANAESRRRRNYWSNDYLPNDTLPINPYIVIFQVTSLLLDRLLQQGSAHYPDWGANPVTLSSFSFVKCLWNCHSPNRRRTKFKTCQLKSMPSHSPFRQLASTAPSTINQTLHIPNIKIRANYSCCDRQRHKSAKITSYLQFILIGNRGKRFFQKVFKKPETKKC